RFENVKEGVGYNVVPPLAADLYRSPKKDLSWTGLPEFANDTVTDYSRPTPTVESASAEGHNKHSTTAKNGESTDSILSKHAVKFVKAGDRPAERPTTNKAEFVKAAERPTTDKVETAKKPALGPDFAMKKRACYNCGDFFHLANDCRKKVQKETTRPAGHRPHGPPMRPQYRAPWVPTVNRNFPPVNRKLPTDAASSLGEDCWDLRAFNSKNLIADAASSLGEAPAKRISNDSEEIARVLTSLDAANVLAGET
nr:hypothetical protein [Tanacetum cinerariifolium]